MLGNLFIVFTPFQLFVSQQIVRQEKLADNVVVFGWGAQFKDAYEMMCIDELWSDKIHIEDINRWNTLHLDKKEMVQMCMRYQKLKSICESHEIGTIYLGEVLNQMCRFVAVTFSHLKYKIVFYEEGTSHYINRPYKEKMSLVNHLNMLLMDTLFFYPKFGCRFAKWHGVPNRPYKGLPMDKRFSMIPFHKEPFDVLLHVEPMFSEKLKAYVESNIPQEANEHRVMLLTDPLRELMQAKDLYLYFDTIKETIESLDKDVVLYLKFHPREISSSREKILEIARNSGIKFKVLSEKVNICVEYYLQVFHFETIYFFNAATYFYNGYAFPKTEFVKLMPVVYKKAVDAGVKNLDYMENMLRMIEPIAVK